MFQLVKKSLPPRGVILLKNETFTCEGEAKVRRTSTRITFAPESNVGNRQSQKDQTRLMI